MRTVCAQARGCLGSYRTSTPVTRYIFHLNPEALRELTPEMREMAGLKHQNAITGRKRVNNRRFPCARARSWIDDYVARSFENRPQTFEQDCAEFCEFWSAVVNYRAMHGAQHSIGYICGSGNLQEVPTRVNQFKSPRKIQRPGVEETGTCSLCKNLHSGACSDRGLGSGICEPSAQVSPILAALVSACLEVRDDAIRLSAQEWGDERLRQLAICMV